MARNEGKIDAIWVGDHWSLLGSEKPKYRYGQKIAYCHEGVNYFGTVAKIYRTNYTPGEPGTGPERTYYIVQPSTGGHSHWVLEKEVIP